MANNLSRHIAMKQSGNSIEAQFGNNDAIELSRSLIIGEAIIDIPRIHKINLLYINPDIEKKIIAICIYRSNSKLGLCFPSMLPLKIMLGRDQTPALGKAIFE